MRKPMRKILTAAALAALVALGPAAMAADQVTLDEKAFTSSDRTESLGGQTSSLALRIAVDGFGELALADGSSNASYVRKVVTRSAPSIPADLLVPCDHPQAVNVGGSDQCVDSDKLTERGFNGDSGDNVAVERLVQAGLAQLETVSEDDGLSDQLVASTMTGLLIGPEAQGVAACDNATTTNSATGFEIPAELAPVLAGSLGIAKCASDASSYPIVSHAGGEADLDLTLTQTLVSNVPQLNEALDEIQAGLEPLPAEVTGPVNSVIDAIQEELESAPLLTLGVGGSGGQVTSATEGIISTGDAVAVDLDVLGGIIQLEIGVGKSTASLLNQVPDASADAVQVHLRVLDITTPDPEDFLIDQEIPLTTGERMAIPGTEGTPLAGEIGLLSGSTDSSCTETDNVKECTARAQADGVFLSLFADPLPNVQIQLMASGSEVGGQYQVASAPPNLPLARTGAATLPTVLAGSGLVGLAAFVRRRFS